MLQELFETHNVSYNLYLINRLLSIRMEEIFPIIDFLKKIKEITTQLISIGELIDKNKLV